MDGGLPLLDPVRVQVGGKGLTVDIDGERAGASPLRLVLEAGSHDVRVAGERGVATFSLQASEGQRWCFADRSRGIKVVSCG